MSRRLFSLALGFALILSFSTLPGCGGGAEVTEGELSPEAKKADEMGQDEMRKLMEGQQ